ncbi:unnamed protein product [Linum tenue]|uniref:Fatty acyl-CoA reductase n=1 Tax=Linum tenue TaxID=586396 RepID=A0AAV0S4N2_9ROSI|nr:unnamed protein product [Linum tenue]
MLPFEHKTVLDKWGVNFQPFISEKVSVVVGDVSCEGLGIHDFHLKEEILKETDMVLNFAAITKFDERYDVALGTNTFGALNVLDFSKKCAKVKLVVHVSTAYVYGEEPGLLMEKPLRWRRARNNNNIAEVLNCETELLQNRLQELHSKKLPHKEIASDMRNLGLERAKYYGWPNTYTFTKAMAEMALLDSKGDLPLVILRPTMNPIRLPEVHKMGQAFFSKDPWRDRHEKPVKVGNGLTDFDDTNLEELRKRTSEKGLYEVDGVELNMDTRSINWEDYIMNVHIPGLVKFVMK